MVIQMVGCSGDGADGDGSGGDRDNTAGDDGNSESTDNGQFIRITVEEVSKLFSKCKVGKAFGPDILYTRILKECSVELAPVFVNFLIYVWIRKLCLIFVGNCQQSAPFPRLQILSAAMVLDL